MAIDRAAVLAWLQASCVAQGVPLLVTDVGIVSQVGVLLRNRGAAWQPRSGERSTRSSVAPSGNDPTRVEQATSGSGGLNGGVVENGSHDRGLPG